MQFFQSIGYSQTLSSRLMHTALNATIAALHICACDYNEKLFTAFLN